MQLCTSSAYRRELIPYLKWLWDEGYLRFEPQPLQKRPLYQLPPSAKHFVRYLEATLKKNTCRGYESSLRNFYRWLDAEGLSLDELTRSHITHWIQYLGENKRSASVRAARIIHIRIYFYWLNEQGILSAAFNRLIRPTDIPRLPEYLPRPLPPNTDRKLIARLENSTMKDSYLWTTKPFTSLRSFKNKALQVLRLTCWNKIQKSERLTMLSTQKH